MVAFARRSFSGSAPDSFLTSPMDGVTLTATCSNLTGWPDGSAGNFVVIFDPGTVNEEKCLASARTGNVLTLVARAYEESAVAHASSTCVVRHGHSAHDADEANNAVSQTIGAIAAKGDLLVGSAANTLAKVAVGSTGQALVVAGGTWAPGAPAVALTSLSGAVTGGNVNISTGGAFIFPNFTLTVGTWLINAWASVLNPSAIDNFTIGAPAGIGAALTTAPTTVPQVLRVPINQQVEVSGSWLVTVTVAGTANIQASSGGAAGIAVNNLCGYTAVKIA